MTRRTLGGAHDWSAVAPYVARAILRRWRREGFFGWTAAPDGPPYPSRTAERPLCTAVLRLAMALASGVEYRSRLGLPLPWPPTWFD